MPYPPATSHHHQPPPPPPTHPLTQPALPASPGGGGVVSYQRFRPKTGGRRHNRAWHYTKKTPKLAFSHMFLRLFRSFWGPNLRGHGVHGRRVFLDAYLKVAFLSIVFLEFWPLCCVISRVLDAFFLRIHCTPPVLWHLLLETLHFYDVFTCFLASRLALGKQSARGRLPLEACFSRCLPRNSLFWHSFSRVFAT